MRTTQDLAGQPLLNELGRAFEQLGPKATAAKGMTKLRAATAAVLNGSAEAYISPVLG